MKKIPLLILVLCGYLSFSQTQQESVKKISKYTSSHKASLLKQYKEFLTIPNVTTDQPGLERNAEFIMEMMKERGINNIQLLEATTPGVTPSVYGEVLVPGAEESLIFYAHYDGQPTNPTQWDKRLDPFQPKLFTGRIDENPTEIPFSEIPESIPGNWRIYSRSASDDKAGVFAILNAYEAIRRNGLKPKYNLKFFFEGEEEAGSPHLDEILEKNSGLLKSKLWIICDGPVHQSGNKQIVFGVRGDTNMHLTIYGPKNPLHSGHYGNWAPNPALMMAELLASMKDESGMVTIEGFYDDVTELTQTEKQALNEVPSVEDQMMKELGIKTSEIKGKNLGEAINLPSLNINGMKSGNVGAMASNQIPTYATAVLDLRLVLGNDWKRQQEKVISHIKKQGYHIVNSEPTDEERATYEKIILIEADEGYNAQRTSLDLPIAKKVIKAVKSSTSEKLVIQPTMGGSLPLYLIEKYLNAETITLPIANHDNNQHAENENIRLKNLFEGIETMAAVMLMEK